MTYSTRLILFTTILAGALGAQPVETLPELTVHLYNYSELTDGGLERTLRQAEAILNRAGLSITWQLCPTTEEAARSNRACARRADADIIQMRILSKEMSKKMTARGIEFGYAIALEDGFGVIAGIYYDRTVREANEIGLAPHVMLGHTMAHEIGHLLLGQQSHSSSGIMSPNWRKKEVDLATRGGFIFTPEQAAAIRMQTIARGRAAQVPGTVGSRALAGN